MNRKIITKGFYQHENGSKTITINGEKTKGDWIEGYYACGRQETMFCEKCENRRFENDKASTTL